jgi:hypothetical protein
LVALARAAGEGKAPGHAQLLRRVLAVLRGVVAAGAPPRRRAAAAAPPPPPPLNAAARALCSRDVVDMLFSALFSHARALPVLRPALALLGDVLGSSACAAGAVGADDALMGRLAGVRRELALAGARMPGNAIAAPALAALEAMDAEAAAVGKLGDTEEERRARVSLQREALAAVGVDAGSEGFSLRGTREALDALLRMLRRARLDAAAARAAAANAAAAKPAAHAAAAR